VGSNHKQQFFDFWKYLMTLRTVSAEYEAKNCCSLLRKNNNSFWHLRTFDSIRFSTHSKYNYQKPPLAPPKDNSTHIKADDRPGGQPSVNVIIFRLQTSGDDWGSCDLFGVSSTKQSRSSFPKLINS
jgi:hypothetical protein